MCGHLWYVITLHPSRITYVWAHVVLIFAQWQRCTYRGPVRRRSRVRLRTEEPLFLSLFFFFRLVFLVIVVLFCFVSLDSDSFFLFPLLPTSCPSPDVLLEVLRFTYF